MDNEIDKQEAKVNALENYMEICKDDLQRWIEKKNEKLAVVQQHQKELDGIEEELNYSLKKARIAEENWEEESKKFDHMFKEV